MTINGVRLRKAGNDIAQRAAEPGGGVPVDQRGPAGRLRVSSAMPMTEASCNASTKLKASATATNSIAYVTGSASEAADDPVWGSGDCGVETELRVDQCTTSYFPYAFVVRLARRLE